MKKRHVITAILWPFLTTSVVLAFFLPDLLHCFDSKIEIILAGKTSAFNTRKTSRVIVIGELKEDREICLETTSLRYRTSEYSYFVPVVKATFDKNDSIDCLMKLDGKQLNDLLKQQKSSNIKINAIIRNKLWEEIDMDIMEKLKKDNLVSGKLLYIEFGAPSFFPVWLGSIIFLLSLVGSYSMIYSAKQANVL